MTEKNTFPAPIGAQTPSTEVVVKVSALNNSQFNIEIPVAGRYRIEVSAMGRAILNLEDYIGNPDGRDYNITGGIPVDSVTPSVISRDGAPLNAGLHSMKLNIKDGTATIDWIKFTLMKQHELTPHILKQKFEGGEWELVWADEFETDGAPDPEVWAYDVGDWGWGNDEAQYYTEGRLENARCENGRLIVEARKDRDDGGWTSARLTTRGRMSMLYGKLECRVMVTAGDGNWPAVWLLGDSYRDELSWPYCGEVDLLESVGSEIDNETGDGPIHFASHTGAYYFKQNNHISTSRQVRQLGGSFHTYVLEWTPEALIMYFDGEQVYIYDKTASELEFPFNEPQNLIINMAMGGSIGGTIDPERSAERIEVEYIRLYGRK